MASIDTTLGWAVLGAGTIARTFSRALDASTTGQLVAVASRSQASADRFGDEFHLPVDARHASYDALLTDDRVTAVYIATPHPLHGEWAIKCLEAGKHVLCEKPLTLNRRDAVAVIDAARRHRRFLMEAFMYRCHPQIPRLLGLIRDGTIGDVRMIDAAFSYHEPFDPQGRPFDAALGGGGILDVGCYPMSLARLIAGAATGAAFADPVDLRGTGTLCATGVDDLAACVLRFDSGVIARIACGTIVDQAHDATIYGSTGSITVHSPWLPAVEGGVSTLTIRRAGHDDERIDIVTDKPLYAYEADVVGAAIAAGRLEPSPPAMTWDDTLGNMAALDRWREELRVVYPQER